MRHQAKQMITIGVWRPLHPHVVEELNRLPRKRKRRSKRSQAIFKLSMKHRMIEHRFAECSAALAIGKCIRHRAPCQSDAPHAVCYTRKVYHFETHVNSPPTSTHHLPFPLI